MKSPKTFAVLLSIASILGITNSAQAATITSLTGFQTFGDQMTGMEVKVTFSDNSTSSAIWGTTGVGAGGASTPDWILAESGDTFGGLWTFTNTSSKTISSLFINAISGNTVFDQTNPSFGTDGSASGITFTYTSGVAPSSFSYDNIVNLVGQPAVGDLYANLTLKWDAGLTGGSSLGFVADTDNAVFVVDPNPPATNVPTPGVFAGILLAAGSFGVAKLRKRIGQNLKVNV
jgi:hypothetical protein